MKQTAKARTTMLRKAFLGIEFKDDAQKQGTFRAIIARFDTGADKQGDVYSGPQAFPTGKAVVLSAYGHTSWDGALPVGDGVVGADEKAAWIDGQFMLDTAAGKDHYLVAKRLAEKGLGEWSYGYDALEFSTSPEDLAGYGDGALRLLKQIDVFEGSMVLIGAGNATGIDSIKAHRMVRALKDVKELDSGSIALIAQIDAMTDDLDAAVDALMLALGIPDPDEEEEAGEPDNAPMLAAASRLAVQAKEAPVAVLSLVSRYKALAAMRAKEGRVLSASNRDRLAALADALNGALADIGDLLAATDPEGGKTVDIEELRSIQMRLEKRRALQVAVH